MMSSSGCWVIQEWLAQGQLKIHKIATFSRRAQTFRRDLDHEDDHTEQEDHCILWGGERPRDPSGAQNRRSYKLRFGWDQTE